EADREKGLIEGVGRVQPTQQRALYRKASNGGSTKCRRQAPEKRGAQTASELDCRVTAQHAECAVAEVHEIHRAKRYRQPNGQQEQKAAKRDTVEKDAGELHDAP